MSSDAMDPAIKVFRPVGILDNTNGTELRREVSDAIAAGVKTILINCQDVHLMDSSGLGALVMILKQVRQVGGELALCSAIDQIQMLLELTSLDSLFQIFPDQEAFEQQFVRG